jgi:tetratricopeptide (TPR) repeat protein
MERMRIVVAWSVLAAAAVAVVVVLAAPTTAHAQRRGAVDPNQARARELYQKGLTHYDLAEYDRAIEEFKQAYELSERPELLFNLAQTYRAKRETAQALHFYRTYLKLKPDAPNRAEVETRIAELVRAGTEKPPPPTVPTTPPPPPPLVVAPPRIEQKAILLAPPVLVPVRLPPPFFKTARGHATIALGVVSAAFLIGAAAAGGVAVARRGAYDASCTRGSCDDSLYTEGRGLAIGADVMIAVGVAAAVTVVVLVVTRPKAPRPVAIGFRF